MSEASAELVNAASDLCAWAQQEGVVMFCLMTTDDGNTKYIGLRMPGPLVPRALRSAADAYEAQVPPETLN